ELRVTFGRQRVEVDGHGPRGLLARLAVGAAHVTRQRVERARAQLVRQLERDPVTRLERRSDSKARGGGRQLDQLRPVSLARAPPASGRRARMRRSSWPCRSIAIRRRRVSWSTALCTR